MFLRFGGKDHRLNKSINHKGVCRTAKATQAPLITDPPRNNFTSLSKKRRKNKKKNVTCDMQHVTPDM